MKKGSLPFDVYTLPNGMRLVHARVKETRIVHCGFIVDAGSMDENPNLQGLAHCLEHMLFKGTQKRNPFQVINRLEVVGGELNAYTTKDKTCIYAAAVKDHFARSVELLCDITLQSSFPEKELIKEKKVIAEEIDMYEDTPEEKIYDDFLAKFYPNHPLGGNILGTVESLKQMTGADLLDFQQQNYRPENMIFSVVGDIAFNRAIKTLEKYLPEFTNKPKQVVRSSFDSYQPFWEEVPTTFKQTHVVWGVPAYPLQDEKRTQMMLLNNLLGGPGMNSKLNIALREKKGFTYGVESNYSSNKYNGLLSIHWSTEPGSFKASLNLVKKELERLVSGKMSAAQLAKYKSQLVGQIIMGEENRSSLMLMAGKSLLDLNEIETLEQVIDEIQAVRFEQIQEVAHALFVAQDPSVLVFYPENNKRG